MRAAGLEAVQLNLDSAGLEPLPAEWDAGTARRIGDAFRQRGVEVSAVSGTFNAIHPDLVWRAECIRRVGLLAERCELLGHAGDHPLHRHPPRDQHVAPSPGQRASRGLD